MPRLKKKEEGNGMMKKYLHSQQDESVLESAMRDPPFEDIKKFFKK